MSSQVVQGRDVREYAAYVPEDRTCCRFCGSPLTDTVVDLGMSPLCESYLTEEALDRMEPFYPLRVEVCRSCSLVQLREYVGREDIFPEYAYFSSFSSSWLEHCSAYCDTAVQRFDLDGGSQVVEVGSNDGYALQYFVEKGIPSLGVDPAANVAKAAVDAGVPTLVDFFGRRVADDLVGDGLHADLLFGKNVMAQVHDINDFVGGFALLLAPRGVITMEFPHLERLIEGNQFDTIYHEHFSYFSLASARTIFAAHGLRVFDVDELHTHGGSIRIYACHDEDDSRPASGRVAEILERERRGGVHSMDYYRSFGEQVEATKRRLLAFLIRARDEGKTVAGYGAPGKGNTLLNYCGIRTDLLEYTVDRNPYKQGRYLPGTHIPIYAPDRLAETRPDYILILPWNLRDEVKAQLTYARDWGAKFVVPIPVTTVLH